MTTPNGDTVGEHPSPTLILAPLRGLTVAPFRRTFVSYFGGFDAAVAPFIPTVAGDRIRPQLLKDVANAEAEAPMELIPQIIGKDPAQVGPFASALRGLGFNRLNLNCGCPWKFVAKKGRGSGLMRDRDALQRMLEAGCEAMPGGFSVKVRLGLQDTTLLAERVDIFNEFPLESVTIHPRTAVQMYEGSVDLEAFEAILPRFRAPVVYNGDIFSVADFECLRKRFPSVHGWMIGRGVLRDLELVERIRRSLAGETGLDDAEPSWAKIRCFHDALYASYRSELFGPAPVLGRMKELWGYLFTRFPQGIPLLRKIQRCASLSEYEHYVDEALANTQTTHRYSGETP